MLVELNENEYRQLKKALDAAQLEEAKKLVEAERVVVSHGYRVVEK